MTENNLVKQLNSLEMDEIGRRFILALNVELSKLGPVEVKKITSFCVTVYMSSKLHTLFTMNGIAHNTVLVFEDIDIRDFILNLTDRASITVGFGSLRDYALEETIACGIGQPAIKTSDVEPVLIMPRAVFDNIETNEDSIRQVLRNNKWLVTIVLIQMYLYLAPGYSVKELAMLANEASEKPSASAEA